ncbi:tRNA uridine(34) 5-carboxymethylaminomethyl modification radical SAM/GNAT enzyme Elp3 [Candidatus Woesearchaeota archaeon]|nr:tRNA uridine(34) 5-carboxymethylaminomethyl modification radical SAM/GNAT enzyme Elp3 [Candidatus Woesearchaeota archaeon]
MDFFSELISWTEEHKPSKQLLAKKKLQLCKKYKRREIPTDVEIYLNTPKGQVGAVRQYLQTKPTRTGSGVAVVATMSKPGICPHGSCTYCPGGLNSYYGDVPKSYTGKEPSTMRGIRNDYDPYRIVFNRLEQYIVLGQNPDKVDQIIMGGTFPAFPKKYQEDFVRLSFKAYNDFSRVFFPRGKFDLEAFKQFFELPSPVGNPEREARITKKILALKDKQAHALEEEEVLNEQVAIRCIGLTIETKPDWGFASHGLEFLKLGCTRVELGIQTVYDEILKCTNRGHTLADSKKSIADLRDLGFKINFHMMPGLPGPSGKRIDRERDIACMREIFSNPEFRPDMLKIYPCMVMPGTPLEKQFRKGAFVPLSTEEAADIIVESKKYVPEYCRIMRVQRDIPTYATTAGVNRTNLRQYVTELAKKRSVKCRCIRCREIKQGVVKGKPSINVQEYEASGGKEFFISIEASDKLLGFVRLRFPPRSLHPAITLKSALIRELHVYGMAVAIGASEEEKSQHKGYGKKLMAEAERIARVNGKDKMVVISGVGVRAYYRKLGYAREGPYMVKSLK